ncbi:MAG: chemotaxis protein CheA [Actinomycetota bacterium]
MSSFLEQYVEEARENVEELVGGLLRLESETGDAVAHTVKELFRFAHNLKGMSGAMGLDGITETAHKMEDLLDKYRTHGGQPTAEEVDVLLAAADALEEMIEDAAGGANPPASAELIQLLINHIGGPGTAAPVLAAPPAEPAAAPAATAIQEPVPDGDGWFDVTLTEGAPLLGARSAMVLQAAAAHGTLEETQPDRSEIESGSLTAFRFRLTGVEDVDSLIAAAESVTDVTSVAPSGAAAPPDAAASATAAAPAAPSAGGVDGGRYEVRLKDDVQLPGARSAIILRVFSDRVELRSTNPDRQQIEAGKAKSFVVELGGDGVAEAVAAVESMSDVASVAPVTAPAGGGGGGGGGGAASARATVRVEVERLDDLMDLVSELVVGRGLLDEHASRLGDRDLSEALAQVHRTISDLQAMVAKVRMISLEKTFGRLTRIVRDTARDVNKPVRFVTSGEDTELDRSMVDEVADPLMHLLRNSVDHGIEDAEARAASGKDLEGEVGLRAFSEGNQVVIEVTDDGGGIDADRVCVKAVERGVVSADEAATMSREQKIDLVFAPGLSTRDEASKISGRGVGMDVVRTAATKLGGNVTVESNTGVGTVFTIKLPLSLAVTEALLVKVCDETWAIPIDQVEETLHIKSEDQRSVGGVPVIDLRGEVVSVVHSREMMYQEQVPEGGLSAVVFKYKGRRLALTVDELVGRSEVVVKPLPSDLNDIELASSVTILGDGSVGLILDVSAVADLSRQRANVFG